MASQPQQKKPPTPVGSEYPSDYVYKPWPWDSIAAKLAIRSMTYLDRPKVAADDD